MIIYTFIIDKARCVGCDNCGIYGNSIFKDSSVDGFEISEESLKEHKIAIDRVLDKCFLDALVIIKGE